MGTEYAIEVDRVWHHYGGQPVLREVSLAVERGELVAVMGPNGMGKSTLLSLVGGAMKPLEGAVRIAGLERRSDAEAENEIRRRVCWLPAESFLPWQVTPREYLHAIGRLHDLPPRRIAEQVERLLAVYELERQADALIGGCSTGQRKKVALAGALVSEREVLVLDEPFSGGLDATGLDATRRILKHLAEREDRTVLMAVPVPELVEGLAHRVAILDRGSLVACDTVDGLRGLAGVEGGLDDVLARLLHADVLDAVEAFVQGGTP